MFRTCIILHAQIIYGLVSVGRECNFSYIKTLWCHFWSSHIRDRTTPLNYEQCGAHMWARLYGARSRSPNGRKGTYDIYGCGEWTGLMIQTVEVDAGVHKDNNTTSAWYGPPYFPKMPSDRPIPSDCGLRGDLLTFDNSVMFACAGVLWNTCLSYEIHVCMCKSYEIHILATKVFANWITSHSNYSWTTIQHLSWVRL